MADKLASLVVDLQVESAKMRSDLDAASRQLKSFGDRASQMAKGASEGFTILKGTIASLAADMVTKLGSALVDSIKLVAEEERAQALLASAAKEMGYAINSSVVPALKAQADAFESNLGVSSEMVNQIQQLMLRFGVAPRDISKTTQAVLDYAAATGMDAVGATQKMLNAVESGSDGIAKMGIHIKATGDKAYDLNAMVGEMAEKFRGSAAAAAETMSGRFAILKEAIEDAAKSMASWVVGMVDAWTRAKFGIGVLEGLTKGFRALNEEFVGDPQKDKMAEIVAASRERVAMEEKLRFAEKRSDVLSGAAGDALSEPFKEAQREVSTYSKQLDEIDAKLKKLKGEYSAASGQTDVTSTRYGPADLTDKQRSDMDRAAKDAEAANLKRQIEAMELWRVQIKQGIDADKERNKETKEFLKASETLRKSYDDLNDTVLNVDARAQSLQGNAYSQIRASVPLADGPGVGIDAAIETFNEQIYNAVSDADFDSVTEAFDRSLGQAKRLAAHIESSITSGIAKLGSAGEMANNAISAFKSGGIWGAVISIVSDILSASSEFGQVVKLLEDDIKSIVSAVGPLSKWFVDLTKYSGDVIDAIMPLITEILSLANMLSGMSIVTQLVKLISKVLNMFMPLVNLLSGMEPILGVLTAAMQAIAKVFRWAFETIQKGILLVLNIVWSAATFINGAINGVGNWILNLGYVLDSEVIKNIGRGINSLAIGVSGINDVIKTVSDMTWDDTADKVAAPVNRLATAALAAAEALTGVPTGYKVALNRFNSMSAAGAGPDFGSTGSGLTGLATVGNRGPKPTETTEGTVSLGNRGARLGETTEGVTVNVSVAGSVVGLREITDAVTFGLKRKTFQSTGSTMGRWPP